MRTFCVHPPDATARRRLFLRHAVLRPGPETSTIREQDSPSNFRPNFWMKK
jgi:hypothetical protein